jgi:hypothetical protein
VEISRRQAKGMTAAALLGYGTLMFQQVDDFEFTLPVKPALHAGLAYTGGTAVLKGERGYHPRPPEARIDPFVRRITGGAIAPDS